MIGALARRWRTRHGRCGRLNPATRETCVLDRGHVSTEHASFGGHFGTLTWWELPG